MPPIAPLISAVFLLVMSAAAGQTRLTLTTRVLEVPDHGIDYLPNEVELRTDGQGRFRVVERGTDVNRVWLQTSPEQYTVLFTFLGHKVALVEACSEARGLCFWPAFDLSAPVNVELHDGPASYQMVETARHHPLSDREVAAIDFDIPADFVRIDRSTLGALLNDLRNR